MKKTRRMILTWVIFFCLASFTLAEADGRVERLEKIGFPKEFAISLAELVEKGTFSGEIDIIKGMFVSAIIRGDVAETDVYLNWDGDYSFQKEEKKAKRYEKDGFVVHRLVNLGDEILFRIGELPKPIQEAVVPVVIPTPPEEEKKAEVPEAEKTPAPVQKTTTGNGVEEVYEAMALPLNLKDLNDQPMTAIIIPIHQTKLIGDGLGKYVITEKDGKEVEKLLVRKVWRTYVEREAEKFPAVITKFGTNLFVVAQGKTKEDLVGKNSVIISGSGKFALTLSGNMVEFDLQKFEESEEYKNAFFEKNPSRIEKDMLVDISPNTENGKVFIEGLRKMFPNNYFVDGRLISIDTDTETLKTLMGVSNNATFMRRVLEKGGWPIASVGTVMCPPCELIRMLIVWGLAASDKTLSGNFGEAIVSGYQSAEALAPYLAECQKEIDYLKTRLR